MVPARTRWFCGCCDRISDKGTAVVAFRHATTVQHADIFFRAAIFFSSAAFVAFGPKATLGHLQRGARCCGVDTIPRIDVARHLPSSGYSSLRCDIHGSRWIDQRRPTLAEYLWFTIPARFHRLPYGTFLVGYSFRSFLRAPSVSGTV